MKRLIAVVALTIALLGIAASPSHAHYVSRIENELLRWHNTKRTRDLRDFTMAHGLALKARMHSEQMMRAGRLYHSSRREMIGYLGRYGRIVAENSGAGSDPYDVWVAWNSSRPHRANIVSRQFRQIGVGVAYNDGTWWLTIIFYGDGY